MGPLSPLRFQPLLRRYIWGGRRLESLGKTLGPGNDYAESWEIVDRGADQSVVAAGPLRGATLQELVRQHGRELLGRHAPVERFPLLFKFLDANDRLSIQVHPDDARAAQLTPPDFGKTEAWVILDTLPDSYLYAGLQQGVDRESLVNEMARRTSELCYERLEPCAGDCIFLPAGVPHALGPGLLVAEIQQSSDTTYRLYDYDRVGPDGKPRALHVAQALEAIDFNYGPVAPQLAEPAREPGVEQLVACDKFVLWRRTLAGEAMIDLGNTCRLLAVLEGEVQIAGDPAGTPLSRGGVALLPAALERAQIATPERAVLLEIFLP